MSLMSQNLAGYRRRLLPEAVPVDHEALHQQKSLRALCGPLHKQAEEAAQTVLKAVIQSAKHGDVKAQQLILERIYPKPTAKQVPLTKRLDLDLKSPEGRHEAPRLVLEAANRGDIGLGEATEFIETLRGVIEMDVLATLKHMQEHIDRLERETLRSHGAKDVQNVQRMNGERPRWGIAVNRVLEGSR